MFDLQWKPAGKSKAGTPIFEAKGGFDGTSEGVRVIWYGDDPPTEIAVKAPKAKASKAKAGQDPTIAKLAKAAGLSYAAYVKALESDE